MVQILSERVLGSNIENYAACIRTLYSYSIYCNIRIDAKESKKQMESLEMWCWRRMEKINLTKKVEIC